MRSSLASLVLVCLCHVLYGQGFNKRYDLLGEGRAQTSWDIERISDTTYMIFLGTEIYDTIGPGNVFTLDGIGSMRVDSRTGMRLTENRFFLPYHLIYPGINDCCDTLLGGYISGGTAVDSVDVVQAYIIAYNENGDTLWTHTYGSQGADWIGAQAKRTLDNGLLMVGAYNQIGFALKTDALGNEQWRRIYPGTSYGSLSSSLPLPAGGYLLCGLAFTGLSGKHWVLRVDDEGNQLWEQLWGGPHDNANCSIVLTNDGGVALAGATAYADDYHDMRPYLAKLSLDDGHIIWEREFGDLHYATASYNIRECSNSDLIICGTTSTPVEEAYVGFLLRTATDGDSLWMRTYFSVDSLFDDGECRLYDVLQTSDGGFIATGPGYSSFTLGFPPGSSQDTWVLKVDSLGCVVPGCNGVTGITAQATNLLGALTLYPNPTSYDLTVQLDLPAAAESKGPLQLTVVSMDGRVVQQRQVSAPSATITLDVHELAPGPYAVHISQGNAWLTGGTFVVQ